MEFEPMDAKSYRSLSTEAYQERRAMVLGLATELPEDATEEQMNAIDVEMGIIDTEDDRRDAVAQRRNRAAIEIKEGAGMPIASVATEPVEPVKAARNLGEHVAQYVREAKPGKSFHLVAPAYSRASGDSHLIPSGIVPAITTYDRNIVEGARVPMNVLDLLGREVIEGNTLVFYREGALEGASPAVTAEGAAKPKAHFADPTPITVSLQKIAAYVKESDEMIKDANFLASSINGRLLYELNYVRQSTVISELLGTSGIQTANYTTADAAPIADAVANAIAAVEEQSGRPADAILITPTLWQTLVVGKNDNGDYYGGGYFTDNAYKSLWSIPVVVTPQLTAGHIVVGAFSTCASLVTKAEGVTVEATNTDQDDFIKNMMTIRAEVRERLAVRRPAGFVDITA